MKIMVTGGAGFIGSNIVDKLINEGYEVVVVDDLSSGCEKNIHKKAEFYRMDIRDERLRSIFNKEKPDYVCHLAAQMDVRRSVSDPIFDAQINVLGTINVIKHCTEHGVKKIIFSSTGGAIYGEQDVFPAPESHPIKPVSPYGITKHVAEQYLHYFKLSHGLDYVSLRYANVYGSRQNPFGEAGVVAIFINKMLLGEQSIIYGDGEQTRDFVYVGDVVRANLAAIQHDISDCAINIGTAVETSVNTLFSCLAEIINPAIKSTYAPPRKGEQQRSVIDNAKAKRFLDWEPETSLIDGLRKTVKYFRVLREPG